MRKRLLVIVLVIVLAAAFSVEFLLPQIASNAVAQGMADLTGSQQVKALVTKSPAMAMLSGSFDSVDVEIREAKLDKIIFSQLQVHLTGVQLHRENLFLRRIITLEQVGEAALTAVISQEEVARYLNQNVKGVKNAVVTISTGKMQAVSSVGLGGFTVAVAVEGRIISDGRKLSFVADRFGLNNAATGNLSGMMLTEIPLVDLQKLPFGVTVREVILDQGKLTLLADNKPKS